MCKAQGRVWSDKQTRQGRGFSLQLARSQTLRCARARQTRTTCVCAGTRLCRGRDTAMALAVCRRTGPRRRQATAGLRGCRHVSCRNKGTGAPMACYTGGSSAAFRARWQQDTRRVHGARNGGLPVEREDDRGGAVKRRSYGESTPCHVRLLRRQRRTGRRHDEGVLAATSSSRTALGVAAASLGSGVTGRRQLLLLSLTTMAAAWSSASSSLGLAAQPTPPSSSLLLLLFPPLLLLLHDSLATHGSLSLPLYSRNPWAL